jgi:dihydrolipoamide dehydrogenase
MSENSKTQLAVIGAGPGGYAAAYLAADIGLSVTLIDPEKNPGGVCLHYGCIPSKALLHAAKLINDTADARELGIDFPGPDIDLDKLRSWKSAVVDRLTGGVGDLGKRRKVDYIRGKAKFIDNKRLEISSNGGETLQLAFENAIIATGSSAVNLPDLIPESERILDSTSALYMRDIPKSLLIIGGGYIGLELGTVYATLGSKVTVVEMTSGLLPGVDRDLVKILSRRLDNLFSAIYLNTTVAKVKVQKNGISVKFKGEGAEKETALFDKVLVSVGRKPNSADLGLENTKVKINERGFIIVDSQRRTGEYSIFAIGDVAGEPMLAHKATHEGRVAAEVIAGKTRAYEPHAIPAVVFTDPEIAWAGLTATQAQELKSNVRIMKFPWPASGRAMTLGRSDGVTKLVVDAESGRVLGVGICGPGAGELIAEGVLAIEMAALVEDLSMTIHPHPTLSETVMEAADLFFGQSTHYYRAAKK